MKSTWNVVKSGIRDRYLVEMRHTDKMIAKDEWGRGGIECDTLEEAQEVAASIVADPQTGKHYQCRIVRLVTHAEEVWCGDEPQVPVKVDPRYWQAP